MRAATASDNMSITPALTRRAWTTVIACLILFAIGTGSIAFALNWIYTHATVRRGAEATIISGTGALWRSSPDNEWTIFNDSVVIDEGDEISTELGTVVWITLFDGSTLEVTERSHLRFERLRESRFSDTTRQVRIALRHGAVYATMAPVTRVEYGELEVLAPENSVIARDTATDDAATSPSFVVEVPAGNAPGIAPFRTAAFRGSIEIETTARNFEMTGPQQYIIDNDGLGHRTDSIRSEILANGSFIEGLEGWDPIYSAEGREPQERIGTVETTDTGSGAREHALHIHRPESTIWARTGVRQAIERTLRLPSALTLEFDVLIESQGAAVDGRETVPLAIELDYTDILGQERAWTAVYATRDGEGVLDANAFTTVIPGRWTHVIVDLHNLEPVPKVLDTIVVYASGGGYDAFMSNLSLTTGEGNNAP
ncbi:MAG: FecR domain-containing protein [Thermomicrobiales bacterium]